MFFFIVREGKITGFLSLTEKINIIIYALLLCRRHEHCSNVACECESAELTQCVVPTETMRCILGIFFGAWSCCYLLLLGFSVRCDSNRWAIPARKALLIIPAELGVCVYECVYVCEIKQKEEGGQSANHYGAFLFHLPADVLRVVFEEIVRHDRGCFRFCPE